MVRLKPSFGKRRPLDEGRGYVIRQELVVEGAAEGDAILVVREAFVSIAPSNTCRDAAQMRLQPVQVPAFM